MKISLHSPDDLLAVLPHLLGFKPTESLVLVPLSAELPTARIDLPTTHAAIDQAWESIRGPYTRHTHPGASLAMVCVSANRDHAHTATRDLQGRLAGIGIATHIRLWATDTTWCDLDTDTTGQQTQAARDRLAAEAVLAGQVPPAPSRDTLAATLVGDREPIARLLPTVRAAADRRGPAREGQWAMRRFRRFEADGIRLDDHDAARLLLALKSIPTRDRLWNTLCRATAPTHSALWTDMTRRAPDDVRAAPAALLGFASWLHGHGAMAWCALDQVPPQPPYSLANLLATALEAGLNPREWESVKKNALPDPTLARARTNTPAPDHPRHQQDL